MTSLSSAAWYTQGSLENVGDFLPANAFPDQALDDVPDLTFLVPRCHVGHFTRGVLADEGALATCGENDALFFENFVSAGDSVSVQHEVTRELPHWRERIAGPETTRNNSFPDLFNDLVVHRFRGVHVD